MEIFKNNIHVTIIFMNLKYDNKNNKENDTLFNQIGLQTARL